MGERADITVMRLAAQATAEGDRAREREKECGIAGVSTHNNCQSKTSTTQKDFQTDLC